VKGNDTVLIEQTVEGVSRKDEDSNDFAIARAHSAYLRQTGTNAVASNPQIAGEMVYKPAARYPCLIPRCFLRPWRVTNIPSQPTSVHSIRFDSPSCTNRRCSLSCDPRRNSVKHSGQAYSGSSIGKLCTAEAWRRRSEPFAKDTAQTLHW
jgi:hypothetical protein